MGAPERLQRPVVTELLGAGARGNLIFWYPLATFRTRLSTDGSAGLWRGVLAVRNAVPGAGELGGTPVLHGYATTATDVGLLERPVVGQEQVKAADSGLFVGPDGSQVVYFRDEHGLNDPGFETLIEHLNAATNQGARIWVLIALPLAQPHVPPRFT